MAPGLKIGENVLVKCGPLQGRCGVVRGKLGDGRKQKWIVKLNSGEEKEFAARALTSRDRPNAGKPRAPASGPREARNEGPRGSDSEQSSASDSEEVEDDEDDESSEEEEAGEAAAASVVNGEE